MTELAVVQPRHADLQLVDHIEGELASVETAAECDLLLRQVSSVQTVAQRLGVLDDDLLRIGKARVRVEHRLGVLLGPPVSGRPRHHGDAKTTSTERMRNRRARQLAAIDETVLEGYLAGASYPAQLRRARLLRECGVAPAPSPRQRRELEARPSLTPATDLLEIVEAFAGLRAEDVFALADKRGVEVPIERLQTLVADLSDRPRTHALRAPMCSCERPWRDDDNCCHYCGRQVA